MNIEIQKKPPKEFLEDIKVTGTKDVLRLQEVQAIKDALQEHLLFIGLDRGNNIRSINLLGIGTSSGVYINSKDILRTALLTASEKVILVHNHPSNTLKASFEDKHITNVTNKFLNIFSIQLLDHIIVAENKVIKHSAIDYIRKVKKAKYVEILYNDIIDSIVSLSEWDNDTFFDFRESDEIKFSNEKNNKIFYTLTKMEREVLILTSEGLKDEEIALRLNTTINTVRVLRNRARTKFKKGLEE